MLVEITKLQTRNKMTKEYICDVFYDNYLSSSSSIQKLFEREIYVFGTARKNNICLI